MFSFHRFSSAILVLLLLVDSSALAQPRQPIVDKFGDPLPEGALLRIGTVRFRTGGRIDSLTFTPDGKQLITADRMSGVHIFDVATGKRLKHLPCINKDEPRWHEPSPFATALVSPTGRHFVEVNNRSMISMRELPSGKELYRIDKQHWQNLSHVRFAPDGKTIAFLANISGVASVYDVATGKPLHTLPGNQACHQFLAFSPEGKSLAVAGQNIPVLLYDVASGQKLAEFGDAKEGFFGSGVFSPDGKLFAFFSKHYAQLEIWDVATVKRQALIPGAFNSSPLTFTPDGRSILSAFEGSKLGVWDTATGKLVRTQSDKFGGFWHNAVSPDGKLLATAQGQCVVLWHLDTGKPVHDLPRHAGHNVNVTFGSDGKTLISTSPSRAHGGDTTAYIWDAVTGKQLADLGWRGGSWPAGAIAANGRVQAEGRAGEKIIVREIASKKVLLEVDEKGFVPSVMGLTPDGSRLMVMQHEPISHGRYKSQLWNVTAGKKVLELPTYHYMDLDPAGRWLMVLEGSTPNRHAQIYDALSGRPLTRGRLNIGNSYRVAVTPLTRALAFTRAEGRIVTLRELATGAMLAEMAVPRETAVMDLAFSPDGALLAGSASDGNVYLWETLIGREVGKLTGHGSRVNSISWSPDGTRLATGSEDLTILVWDTSPWLKPAPDELTLTAKELDKLWGDLAERGDERGYQAMLRLSHASKDALRLFRKHLRPTTAAEMARARELLAKLDDDRFSIRTRATHELEKLSDLALAEVRKALTVPSSTLETRLRLEQLLKKLTNEPPSGAQLQQLRALTALELIATRDARALVSELAQGESDSWWTEEAQATRRRMEAGNR